MSFPLGIPLCYIVSKALRTLVREKIREADRKSTRRESSPTEKRIDYAKAEEGLKTTPNSECALNALAIDNPVKYARLYLDGTIQMWIDAEDSLVSLRGIFLPIVFFHLATFNCHMNITAISAYSHCGSLY